MRSLQPREEVLQVTQQERPASVHLWNWGKLGFEEKLGGPPIHLCSSPASRVAELKRDSGAFQDQNLKDQLPTKPSARSLRPW